MQKIFNKFLIEKFVFFGLHLASFQTYFDSSLRPYVCGARKKMIFFDLKKIFLSLRIAFHFLTKVNLSGKKILFVGCPSVIEKEFSLLCCKHGHFYLGSWTQGFLKKLKKSSLREPNGFPAVIVVFSPSCFQQVIEETSYYDIPIIAFVKGNDCPMKIDYPIYGNFTSPKGGQFLVNLFQQFFLVSKLKSKIKIK